MTSHIEEAKCVLWLHDSWSAATVQRFRIAFERELPAKMSIYKWCSLFDETGWIFKEKIPDRIGQLLKLRWVRFARLSFVVHTGQMGA
jgi:hypothetical protein